MKNFFHFYRLVYIILILARKGILSEIAKSSLLTSKVQNWLKLINFFIGKNNNEFNLGKSFYEILNYGNQIATM